MKTKTVGQFDSAATETSAPHKEKRHALPAPLDPLFPGAEYLGPTPLISVPDMDPEYPLEKALWSAFPALKAHKIKVYRSVNAGFDFSTSHKPNIPESYAIVINKLERATGSCGLGISLQPDVWHRLSLEHSARMV